MRHVIKAQSLSASSCIFLSIVMAGCSSQWSIFTSAQGFAISLPEDPEVRRSRLQVDGSEVPWSWYIARSSVDVEKQLPSVTFMVGASDVLAAQAVDKVADAARKIVVSPDSTQRVVASEQVASGPCRIVKLELSDENLTTLAEVRSCGNQVFSLVVTGPDSAARALAPAFLASFVLTKPVG